MGLPFLYLKGPQVEVSKLWCLSVPEGCFNLNKQCRLDESSLYARVPVIIGVIRIQWVNCLLIIFAIWPDKMSTLIWIQTV